MPLIQAICRARWSALTVAGLLMLGCTTGGGSHSAPSEPAAEPTCSAAILADLQALPEQVDASEGGRIHLALGNLPVDTTAFVSLPDGWGSTRRDADTWIHVPYGAAGTHALTLRVTCDPATATRNITATIRALSWSQVGPWTGAEGPSAREHPSIWVDENNPDRLLMFGGMLFVPRQYTVAWDIWELNLATETWQQLTPANEPPHVAANRMATVPGTSLAYLHGGSGENAPPSTQMYALNYAPGALNWIPVPLRGGRVPAAILASLFYEPSRARVLNVCGLTADNNGHCNVNAYNEATGIWASVPAVGGPPAGRLGFAHAYDAQMQRFVLFSGEQAFSGPANAAQDAWALDLSVEPPTWTKLFETDSPRLGRRNSCWALDPVGHRLFVWGGTATGATAFQGVYAIDLEPGHEAIRKVEVPAGPDARSSCAGVYDRGRHRILLGFGNNERGIFADLWALNL